MKRLSSAAAVSLTAFLIAAMIAVVVEAGSFAVLRLTILRQTWKRAPAEDLAVYQQPWGRQLWREQREVLRQTYGPFLQRKTKPHAGALVNVDARGIRRTTGSQCDASSPVVWMFGGSTVWGFGNPDSTTIPSLLAAEWRRRGRPACVVNYGENSWTTTQGVIKLMLELKEARRPPDAVIFISGCNDVLTPFLLTGNPALEADYVQYRDSLENLLTAGRGTWSWLKVTNTALLFKGLSRRLRSAPESAMNRDSAALARDVASDFERSIRFVEGAGQAYGFRGEFYWQPLAVVSAKRFTAEESRVMRIHSPFYESEANGARRVLALLRKLKEPHLHDINAIFDDVRSSVFIDECHLQPAGNAIVARRIADDFLPERHAGATHP